VKVGNYTLKVTANGFASVERPNLRVDVSQRLGVNVSLKPGATSEVVTVTAAPQLQTEDASTGQVFDTKTINDTPLNGRNYVFIAQLTTGVAPPNQGFGQVAGSGDFTSNGSRVSQNNFVLDGVDNNSNMQDFLNGATYAVRPPPDALEEFKVQSSDYSAELGRGTGAAINASIKSGTNSFHGSLWEYFSSDKLDAADYFDRTGKTAYHRNQFGATIGGPIWKNKLFFFADSQATLISSYVTASPNNTVPTAAMRNGDFSELLDANNTNGNGVIPLYLTGGNPTATAGGTEDPNGPQRYLTCNGVRNVICPGLINPVAQRILNLFSCPTRAGRTRHSRTTPFLRLLLPTTQRSTIFDSTSTPRRRTRLLAAIAIRTTHLTRSLPSASWMGVGSVSAARSRTMARAASSARRTSFPRHSPTNSALATTGCLRHINRPIANGTWPRSWGWAVFPLLRIWAGCRTSALARSATASASTASAWQPMFLQTSCKTCCRSSITSPRCGDGIA